MTTFSLKDYMHIMPSSPPKYEPAKIVLVTLKYNNLIPLLLARLLLQRILRYWTHVGHLSEGIPLERH